MLRIAAASFFLLAFFFTGCASNRAELAGRPPRFIELQTEQSASTIHFPRGYYSLGEEDASGYYYRSPHGVIKHAFAGFQPYDGGIFLGKKKGELRGYIIWAGGRTRIGNFARASLRLVN